MPELRMTESEITKDFHAVLEKIRQGNDVVIEQDHQAVAIIKPAFVKPRRLSESIAIAEALEKKRGHAVSLDLEFSTDLADVIRRHREPLDTSRWD